MLFLLRGNNYRSLRLALKLERAVEGLEILASDVPGHGRPILGLSCAVCKWAGATASRTPCNTAAG